MEQAAAVLHLKTFSQGHEVGEAEPLTAPQKVRPTRGIHDRREGIPLETWRRFLDLPPLFLVLKSTRGMVPFHPLEPLSRRLFAMSSRYALKAAATR